MGSLPSPLAALNPKLEIRNWKPILKHNERKPKNTAAVPVTADAGNPCESGRGLPQSKTLARNPWAIELPPGFGLRESSRAFVAGTTAAFFARQTSARARKSGRGLPHSKTLRKQGHLQKRVSVWDWGSSFHEPFSVWSSGFSRWRAGKSHAAQNSSTSGFLELASAKAGTPNHDVSPPHKFGELVRDG